MLEGMVDEDELFLHCEGHMVSVNEPVKGSITEVYYILMMPGAKVTASRNIISITPMLKWQ